MSGEIDEIIHQPVRTRIMAFLGNAGETNYTDLKTALELTDGHMSTHMKKLIEADYVTATKTFVKQKPNTTYKLSRLGRSRLNIYFESLKKMIQGN